MLLSQRKGLALKARAVPRRVCPRPGSHDATVDRVARLRVRDHAVETDLGVADP